MSEEDITVNSSNTKDRKFDLVVGSLEDIVVGDTFQQMHDDFMDNYCNEFEDSEENKLSYTSIFNDYVGMLEKYIESELSKRIKEFNMADFMNHLSTRKNEISPELFEMLLSFTDFLTFKQLMIDHKDFRSGNVVDLSLGLTITPLSNIDREEK